jgi:hypothetical protein
VLRLLRVLQFDRDGDGVLNAEERAACVTAIANGYGKAFFHVTSGPATLPEHRVQQKRGQVLMEENESWQKLVRRRRVTCRGGMACDACVGSPGCAVLSCAVLCCAVLCCAVLCCAVLCCAVLCCAVLCCAVLCCCVVLCCVVLCYSILLAVSGGIICVVLLAALLLCSTTHTRRRTARPRTASRRSRRRVQAVRARSCPRTIPASS